MSLALESLRDSMEGSTPAIIATCAPGEIPAELVEQLADNGRMILPVGVGLEAQQLVIVRRCGQTVTCAGDLPVRFVPMVP